MSEIKDTNKAIKFPDSHYIGFNSRPTADNVPLGFMTPDGTDAAAKKRKESVDRWAEGNYWNKPKEVIPPVTYKNEPMIGFKMSRSIKRDSSWGQGNVKWRIEDPRGFELEISSPNFAQIISLCTLEKGEIQEQCIWGRLGSENILVPVDSDVYRVAMENTQRIAKKASLRDLKLGDTVIMQNGDKGIYMGVFYFFYGSYDYSKVGTEASDRKRYVFKSIDGHTPYFAVSSPKMSEIISGDGTLTQEAAEKELNQAIQDKKKDRYGYVISENSFNGTILAVTSTPPKKSDFIITKEASQPFSEAQKALAGPFWGMLGEKLVSFDMRDYHNICARNRNGFDKVYVPEWDMAKLDQEYPEFELVQSQYNRWGYNNDYHRTPHTVMPEEVWTYSFQVQTQYSGLLTVMDKPE